MKAKPPLEIEVKRAYAAPARGDGRRVLVDRIWPRGVSKDAAALDAWVKELAPSSELRAWFKHEPAKWAAFKRRYFAELDEQEAALAELVAASTRRRLTLIFAAKDAEHNNAVALKEYLERRFVRSRR